MRLDELVAVNLGVLAEATIAPHRGFTVITGETGTGKTLLLGALVTLLDGAIRQDRIGPHGDRASVSARFVDDDTELVARVQSNRGGRSRAYLDGAAAAGAEIGERLAPVLDVVAQHDGLRLRRADTVRELLDGLLDTAGRAALDAYREVWEEALAHRHDVERIGGRERDLLRSLDLARHEADEIAAADITPGEDTEVAARVERLRNAQELIELSASAEGALETAIDALGVALDAVRRLARIDADAGVDQGVGAAFSETEEAARAARVYREGLSHDPEELERLVARQVRLVELKRRYGHDLTEVIAYGVRAAARVGEWEALLETAATLEARGSVIAERLATAGAALGEHRRRIAERLTGEVEAHLRDLGFGDPRVVFVFSSVEAAPFGTDRVELRFASDRRLEPGPIATTASGGELSRIVLALRLAAGVDTVPVVVFDEIDAGVGGATALSLAEKLASIAAHSQVLCVTHLPQVAAFADRHVVVERHGTAATAREVDGEERVRELARMLSGLEDSERGRDHALELLALGQRARRP